MSLARNLALAVLALGLVAGAMARSSPAPRAEAAPQEVLLIHNVTCLLLTALVDDAEDPLESPAACLSLNQPVNLFDVSQLLGGVDDADDPQKIDPEDFAALALDGDQLQDTNGQLTVVAFVDDDAPVQFRTNRAEFSPAAGVFTPIADCAVGGDYVDEDCDGDGTMDDGVVAINLLGINGEPAHGAGEVEVESEGSVVIVPFTVVGTPDEVELQALETTIQAGLESDECPLPGDVAGFTAALGEPEKTIVFGRVLDQDGSQITGGILEWVVNDSEIGVVASGITPSLDLGAFGFGAPQIACGQETPGTLTITANLVQGVDLGGESLAGCNIGDAGCTVIVPASDIESTSTDLTVVGPPASMTMSVDPASIPCDGTTAATVRATVTDSEGNNVANGQKVTFNVQVLGTANPITGTTSDGVASTMVTPLALSGAETGVPVVATAGSVTASTIVACTGGAAPPPAGPTPGTGTPGGVISPPDTGTGGDHGTGAIALWQAVLVVMLGVSMVGGSVLAARRSD